MYKMVKDLSRNEAGYLAGIIDGEGTVTLSRDRKGAQRRLAVTVSNTELSILFHVKRVIGAGIITNKKVSKSTYAPAFTYQIYNRQALEVLRQTFPYLHSYKRRRAQLVLKKYLELTPRNGKYSADMLEKRQKFIDDFFVITAAT